MAEILNLRLARKQKTRALKEQQAAENRVIHGRTKAERELEKVRDLKAREHLAGHRREQNDQ